MRFFYDPVHRYKTQLCVHFESRGLCSYGNQCAFAHGNSELQQKVRTAREKNNAFSKSPRTHQKMGQHYSSIHKGGKGSKGGKGVTGGSRSNGSNRNQNYYGGSGAGENISNGTNSSDDSTADGSTPRHSKTKVSYQTAAFFAAPSEPVGRLGNGWNECMGNLGDGWGEASQQDVIFTPPVPRELCMLPKQGIQDEGKSFFDLKSARGIQIPNGEEYVMARNNSEPIETYYYSNEQKAGWFSKASPSATHRSEETSVPLHHAGSPLELPPPNMSFPSAVERHNGHEHRHSADVSGGIPSEVSPVGDMGSIFSRMGLQGQFALGQDDGGVDVEAFALGILGGPGFGGLNYGFEGGKY